MSDQRRFSRIKCIENSTIETGCGSSEVRLLDLSLRGALVEYGSGLAPQSGDRWQLHYHLSGSDITLEFTAEVIHVRDGQAGVKFVEMDLDTMTHLRSLMEARTVNPEQVRYELDFLVDD